MGFAPTTWTPLYREGNQLPFLNVHDLAILLRTIPTGLEHPLAFAMNSFQTLSVTLHVLHTYVNYKDAHGVPMYPWSDVRRPEL